MIQFSGQFRVLIACMIIVPGLPQVRVPHSSELATGSVSGTVRVVGGQHTLPLAHAKLRLTSISDENGEYQATTDGTGRYAIELPPGTYKMLLAWMGGDDCSEIHRAAFRLDAGAHLTFDFLTMECPHSDPIIWRSEEEAKKHVRPKPETNPMKMNVPLTEQTENYQEHIIPAEQNRGPEIVLSFGKYDNRVDEIRYFQLHQTVINPKHIPNLPILLSLPVTITVDRYTIRASSVILNKRKMVFKAGGQVSLSDGTHTSNGESATLFFSGGEPKIKVNR